MFYLDPGLKVSIIGDVEAAKAVIETKLGNVKQFKVLFALTELQL